MDVRIESFPGWPAICLRHVGPYREVGPSFGRMIRWASQNGLLVPGHKIIGLSYDDPATVPAADLRYDICVTVAAAVAGMPADFRAETIGGGRWAIHTLKGSYDGLKPVFDYLRGPWLRAHGATQDDRPCMEIYLNDASEVPESALLTDVCVPLCP
jgi:AraC family transcriptional regulator